MACDMKMLVPASRVWRYVTHSEVRDARDRLLRSLVAPLPRRKTYECIPSSDFLPPCTVLLHAVGRGSQGLTARPPLPATAVKDVLRRPYLPH